MFKESSMGQTHHYGDSRTPPHEDTSNTLYCQTGETLVTFEPNSKIAPLLYDTEIFNEFSGLLNQTRKRLLVELEGKVKKLEKDFIWDNGECSICGFMSIVADESHHCASYNEALINVLEILTNLIKEYEE